jgi:hypothetical protein
MKDFNYGVENFKEKLNLDLVERHTISLTAFREKFEKSHTILTQESLENFLKDSIDILEKGGSIKSQTEQVSQFKRILVDTGEKVVPLFVRKNEDFIEKSGENDIEKALEFSSYDSQQMFEKTGLEIKTKLELLKVNLTTFIQDIISKMSVIRQVIGEVEPNEICGEYTYGDYPKGLISPVPLTRYDWYSYNRDNGGLEGEYRKEQQETEESKTLRKNMYLYNDLLSEFINSKKKQIDCDVFIRNMVDKEKYKISKSALIQLGF